MPYESYTNESDVQLAAQIDRYKLGPGVSPGGSAFWASEAAMNALGNDEMNVAKLMQVRASLGNQSMDMRRSVSEDNTKKKEADEFDTFLMDSKNDYIPGDDIGNAERMQQRQHDSMGNKLIDGVIGKRFAASGFSRKGREQASDELDWQHTENLRDEKQQTDVIATRLALAESKRIDDKYATVIANEDSSKMVALGEALGMTYEDDPELAELVSAHATRLTAGGKYEEVDHIAKIMEAYSGISSIRRAYSPDIARIQELSASFKPFGIELAVNDPEKKKEAYALAAAKINEIQADPAKSDQEKANWVRNFDELKKKDATLMGVSSDRAIAQQMLHDLFRDPPKDMNSPEFVEWNVSKNNALIRIGKLGGAAKARFAEVDRQTALIEQQLVIEKKHVDILKTRQGMALAKDNQELRHALADMRRDGMAVERIAVALRSAKLIDSKTIRNQDDLINLLNGLMPEVDRMLEEGRPDVGTSGYKK